MKRLLLFLLPVLIIMPLMAFAQDNETEPALADVPIEFSTGEILIIVVGAFAGLTTAYLRMRKSRSDAIAKGEEWKFDATRFIDRIVMAVIASVPLAIGAAANVIVLNPFTIIMIYLAALGSSELILELREKNSSKKK